MDQILNLKKKGQSLSKKIIFLGIMILLIGVGVWFIRGDVNFTTIYPTSNISTNESFVNITINLSNDNLQNITYSWGGTNFSVFNPWNDPSLRAYYSFDYYNYTGIFDNSSSNRFMNFIGPGVNVSNLTLGERGNYITFGKNISVGLQDILYTASGNEPVNNTNSQWSVSVWIKYHNATTIGGGVTQQARAFNLFGYNSWVSLSDNPSVTNCDADIYYQNTTGSNIENPIDCKCVQDQWYNLVITFFNDTSSSINVSSYFNGVLYDTERTTNVNISLVNGAYNYLNYNARGFMIGGDTGYGSASYVKVNGSLDEFMVFNKTLSQSEISSLYNYYLPKFNATDYQFYANTTLNYSSSLINNTNPVRTFDYFLCSYNLTNQVCSQKKTITQNIRFVNLVANFSEIIGKVRDNFYGANTHTAYLTVNTTIAPYGNGTACTYCSNTTWHRQTWADGGFDLQRLDASLGSRYNTIENPSFEYWRNESNVNVTTNLEMAQGWLNFVNGGALIGKSTDAHSGQYSMNITQSYGSSYFGTYFSNVYDLKLKNNTNYTASIWLKGNGTFTLQFQVSGGSYTNCGINTFTITDSDGWVNKISSCNITLADSNDYWVDIDNINTGEYLLVDDFSMTQNGSAYNWWRTATDDRLKSTAQWAHENPNNKILLIIDYMVTSLANYSSGCNWSYSGGGRCGAYDWNIYAEMALDYYDYVSNNGEYNDAFLVQFWNEPYGGFLLDNYTNYNSQRSVEYNRGYNASYLLFNLSYPDVPFGGPSGYYSYPELLENFFSNFSNQTDFIEVHPYMDKYKSLTNGMYNKTKFIFDMCNKYAGSGCSWIINGEWQPTNWLLENNTNQTNEYTNNILWAYQDILNNYPSNVSMVLYQWSEAYLYNDTTRYPQWPYKLAIVSEPMLDNYLGTPYNVTKYLSSICSVNSTVKKGYSSDENILITLCQNNNRYAIVLNNVNNLSSLNVTINLSLTNGTILYPYNNVTNLITKEVIPVNSGILQIGVMDSWQKDSINNVLFLSSGVPPTITNLLPPNNTNTTNANINFSANLSDDVGLDNATLYIMNDSDKNLVSRFVDYTSGELSSIFNNVIALFNGVYHWWIELWDKENKQIISDNQTLSINAYPPNITFESPTPTNNSIINTATPTIIANISDGSNFGTSSFIDFNRSLLGYWSMDYYNYTGVFDNSSYGTFGRFFGLNYTNLTLGERGYAMQFNETSGSYIKIKPYNLSNFSFSAWVFRSRLNEVSDPAILDTGLAYSTNKGILWMVDKDTNKQLIYLGNASVKLDSINTVDANKWVHLVVTFNGTHLTFYTNGVKGTVTTGSPVDYVSTEYGSIGVQGNGEANPWNGSIDEVMIFNYPLSETEVLALNNSQVNKFNVTFSNLQDGNYNYTVSAIDKLGYFNSSTQNFLIGIPPTFTTIPNNVSLFYGNESLNVTFIATDETGFSMYYINDTRFNMMNSTGWLTNATPMEVGHYQINVSINDTSNNINWTLFNVEVNKSQDFCQILFNETSPLEFNKHFYVWANCSLPSTLYRNGTVITNNSEQSLGVGAYNFSFIRSSSNFTYFYNETQFIIRDTTIPLINFEEPTTNSTNLSQSNIYLNVTTSDLSNSSVLSNIGLKLWLRYNNETGENNTFALDYSGNYNNGTGNNTISTTGKLGDCYSFNGVNSSVKIAQNPSSFNITREITLSSWIYIDSYTCYRRILAKSYLTNAKPFTIYGLLTDCNSSNGFGDNKKSIRMELASNNTQHLVRSTTDLVEGQWYLITGTYDQTNGARLFINGVLDNSTLLKVTSYSPVTLISVSNLTNGFIDNNLNNLSIGSSRYNDTPADFFKGKIDESIVVNRAWSLNEIQAYYNATRLDHNITNLADGNYNVTAYAQDSSGNVNSTSRWVTLDTTSPFINITSPVNNYQIIDYVSGNVPVNVNFSQSDINNNSCYYSLSGAFNISNTAVSCNNGYNIFTFYINASGSYTLTVLANDSAGNTNSSNINFSVLAYSGPTSTGPHSGSDNAVQTNPNLNLTDFGRDFDRVYNRTFVCNEVKLFLYAYTLNYTSDQFNNFRNNLGTKMGIAIGEETLTNVIDNFNEFCGIQYPLNPNNPQNTEEDSGNKTNFLYIVGGAIIVFIIIMLISFAGSARRSSRSMEAMAMKSLSKY